MVTCWMLLKTSDRYSVRYIISLLHASSLSNVEHALGRDSCQELHITGRGSCWQAARSLASHQSMQSPRSRLHNCRTIHLHCLTSRRLSMSSSAYCQQQTLHDCPMLHFQARSNHTQQELFLPQSYADCCLAWLTANSMSCALSLPVGFCSIRLNISVIMISSSRGVSSLPTYAAKSSPLTCTTTTYPTPANVKQRRMMIDWHPQFQTANSVLLHSHWIAQPCILCSDCLPRSTG